MEIRLNLLLSNTISRTGRERLHNFSLIILEFDVVSVYSAFRDEFVGMCEIGWGEESSCWCHRDDDIA